MNGTGIYEDDILFNSQLNIKSEVIYYAPEGSYYYKDEHGNLNNFTPSVSSEEEIVGNTYKNLELNRIIK